MAISGQNLYRYTVGCGVEMTVVSPMLIGREGWRERKFGRRKKYILLLSSDSWFEVKSTKKYHYPGAHFINKDISSTQSPSWMSHAMNTQERPQFTGENHHQLYNENQLSKGHYHDNHRQVIIIKVGCCRTAKSLVPTWQITFPPSIFDNCVAIPVLWCSIGDCSGIQNWYCSVIVDPRGVCHNRLSPNIHALLFTHPTTMMVMVVKVMAWRCGQGQSGGEGGGTIINIKLVTRDIEDACTNSSINREAFFATMDNLLGCASSVSHVS